jgi:hypothetical protein
MMQSARPVAERQWRHPAAGTSYPQQNVAMPSQGHN